MPLSHKTSVILHRAGHTDSYGQNSPCIFRVWLWHDSCSLQPSSSLSPSAHIVWSASQVAGQVSGHMFPFISSSFLMHISRFGQPFSSRPWGQENSSHVSFVVVISVILLKSDCLFWRNKACLSSRTYWSGKTVLFAVAVTLVRTWQFSLHITGHSDSSGQNSPKISIVLFLHADCVLQHSSIPHKVTGSTGHDISSSLHFGWHAEKWIIEHYIDIIIEAVFNQYLWLKNI